MAILDIITAGCYTEVEMITKTEKEIRHLQEENKFLRHFDTDKSLYLQKLNKIRIKELREEVRK